jgi:hypothetical protein
MARRPRCDAPEDLGAANMQSLGAGGGDERDAGDLGAGGGAGATRAVDPMTRRTAKRGRRTAEPVTESGSGWPRDRGDDPPRRRRAPRAETEEAGEPHRPITSWPRHREGDEPGVDVPPG